MKTLIRPMFPLLMALLLVACAHPDKQQVAGDTQRMLTFMKSTLYDNYGNTMAPDTFWHLF